MRSNIGPYALVAKLGEGGMAEVFKAFKPGPFGVEKPVALKKILPPFHDRKDIVSMFLTEARIHSRLSHPKLVELIEFFEFEKSFVLVMEYFKGKNLQQIMTDAKKKGLFLPWEAAVHVAKDVLEALEYIHATRGPEGPLNIVHRDVSPQNILVSWRGLVKLSDFGVALADVERETTASGALKGKVRYMSPEQIQGLPLDHRSDLFSTGILLYEMVCGRSPFRAKADFEVMSLITSHTFDPPHSQVQNVPNALLDCIVKAMQKEPDHRYQTASDMRKALLLMQDAAWVSEGTELFKQWISTVYAEHQMHNESGLSQTLILPPKSRRGRSIRWLILAFVILGALGAILYGLTRHQEMRRDSIPALTELTSLEFKGQAGTLVFLNGKKIGTLPFEGPYRIQPGSYVVLFLGLNGKKTVHTVRLERGESLRVESSP